MGFQFNGTQANVTLSGQIGQPIPTPSQTVVNVKSVGNGANQNTYTVNVGKTFYLFGVFLQEGANMTIYANDGTTARLYLTAIATDAKWIASSSPIAMYTAGQNVVCSVVNAKAYGIWGIEQ